MTTLAVALPAVAKLMTRLTGLQIAEERDGPQKVIDPQKRGKLQYWVSACKTLGQDDIRYVDGGDHLEETILGFRQMTITVRFEGYDHRPGQDALFYLERMGLRVRLPSATAELNAVDMSLVSVENFTNLSRVYDVSDRRWSIGQKDFIFSVMLVETPADGAGDNPVGWIQTVLVDSTTLNGEGGAPLAKQIHLTVSRP